MEADTEDREISNVDATVLNENSKESVNEDVPICSRGMSDVFPQIVNMLDVKSFMNLAKTCTQLYKRCMEDKAIKFNAYVYSINVYSDVGGVGFYISSNGVASEHLRGYVAMLRKKHFNLTVNNLRIDDTANVASIDHLKDIGVKKVRNMIIYDYSSNLETITSFIKEFRVNSLHVWNLPEFLPILRSLLQSDVLEEIDYDGQIPVDLILELDSSIKMIKVERLENMDWYKFKQILWKIQSGTLHRLSFRNGVHIWDNVDVYPYDEEEELPEERPLVFERNLYQNDEIEYYILHWQGGVTKCVLVLRLEIFKCAPSEFPPILRKEEDVLKDLTDMVPKVSCYERQFNTFMNTFELIKPTFEDPLPSERPLYFEAENGFLKLTDDKNLMECVWENGQAKWKTFDYLTCSYLNLLRSHRALMKLIFNEHLQEPIVTGWCFECGGLKEFDYWLDDYKKLDFGHSDTLPKDRPLVFEMLPSENDEFEKLCVILFDDYLLQCRFWKDEVELDYCEPWNRPPILIDAKSVMELLQKTTNQRDVTIRVDLETFLCGFELFKTSLSECYNRIPLVFEKSHNTDGNLLEERWFYFNGIFKIMWQNGRASLCDA